MADMDEKGSTLSWAVPASTLNGLSTEVSSVKDDSVDDDARSEPSTHASDGPEEHIAPTDQISPAGRHDCQNCRGLEVTKAAIRSPGTEEDDPLALKQLRREDVSSKQIKTAYPKKNPRKRRRLRKYYEQQNELIDTFLGTPDEERQAEAEQEKDGPKVKIAIYGSAAVNLCLFVIQLYAAVSTGSLSLFATAADAFMDLVSSCVMLVTTRMARRPSVYKYPVGRTRIETAGIILFCSLMTTVAVELIVESVRALTAGERTDNKLQTVPLVCVGLALFSKSCLFVYCFLLRRYPAARTFMLDHRNDIVVNTFGLTMSIVGTALVWWVDPLGAILIGCLILFSWASTAIGQIFLLVGKGAPREFLSKLIYVSITHDEHILKVDTCRAYHAGEKYYVEVDVIMDEDLPLKISHDVGQSLQRKLEGLEDVERAFVHVDYEADHDIAEEHKPLHNKDDAAKSLKDIFRRKKAEVETEAAVV